MATSAKDALATIDQFLEKVAGDEANAGRSKKAAANTEAGSIGGETTHPVKKVEDGTEPAQEGARSSENTSDVKEDQGEASVDSTAEATAKSAAAKKASQKRAEGDAAADHLQLGTNVQATGDDSSVETASAKAKKEDGSIGGPSSHPARTDNDELDGHKYAGDVSKASLEKLAEELSELGNAICADIALTGNAGKQASQQASKQQNGKQAAATKQAETCETCGSDECTCEKTAAAIDPDLAAQVGWEMAGLMTGQFDKQAADSLVRNTVEDIIKVAAEDGTNVADYLDEWNRTKLARQKRAEGEEEAAAAEAGGDPAAAGGGDPMAAMGGGGGDPAAAGGAPMAGGAGGGGEAGLQELQAILDQLGITPEELIEALSSQAGGAGGGDPMAGGAGGGDPMAAMGGGGGDPMAAMGGAAAGGGDPMAAAGGGAAGGMMPPPGGGGMEAMASAGNKKKQAAAPQSDEKTAAMSSVIKELVTRSRQLKAAQARK